MKRLVKQLLAILGVSAFLFVMFSLLLDGRYMLAGWDERMITAAAVLLLTGSVFAGGFRPQPLDMLSVYVRLTS